MQLKIYDEEGNQMDAYYGQMSDIFVRFAEDYKDEFIFDEGERDIMVQLLKNDWADYNFNAFLEKLVEIDAIQDFDLREECDSESEGQRQSDTDMDSIKEDSQE